MVKLACSAPWAWSAPTGQARRARQPKPMQSAPAALQMADAGGDIVARAGNAPTDRLSSTSVPSRIRTDLGLPPARERRALR